jgi:hypothetical protein
MRELIRRWTLVVAAAASVAGVRPCTLCANSVASIAVDPSGRVYFSDDLRNRIWQVDSRGVRTLLMDGKHTHHLVLGPDRALYGEYVPMNPADPLRAGLWRREPGGTLTEILHTYRNEAGGIYEGSVFTLDREANLYFFHACQILRRAPDGHVVPWAGRNCSHLAWDDAALRYGHLHGSLAWAPDGSLLVSDARTVRRVARDGSVRTLSGSLVELFAPPQAGELGFERVMGLGVNSRGGLIVADRGCRCVLRLSADGHSRTLFRAGWSWTPAGLAVCGDEVLLLEERLALPRFLAAWLGTPKLIRIHADGTAETLGTVVGRESVSKPAAIGGILIIALGNWPL